MGPTFSPTNLPRSSALGPDFDAPDPSAQLSTAGTAFTALTLKRQRQLCIDQRERDHMGDAGVGSLKPRARRG